MLQHHVKVVGANGQLSLGKALAGKLVVIDQIDNGTWLIKSGTFIPDAEQWLYQDNNMASLENALTWAGENKPEDNFEELAKRMEHG